MNCANHPDVPVSVFCQFCGKPLCKECARTIGNIVGCEPCIATRLSAAAPPQGSYTGNVGDSQTSQYTATSPLPPHSLPATSNPGLAFALGWIPGVGAMYNGQLAKGLVHVLILAILVSLSDTTHGVVGFMIAAWVIYQVFDAYQTAVARRDGLPIPNPLGLNDIGPWITGQYGNPFATYPAPAASVSSPAPPVPEMASAIPPMPPDPYDTPETSPGVPTGAIVLIGIGILFLLGNLGILSSHWLNRTWPLLLIALGVWLLIRRNQTPPGPTPGGMAGGSL